ncbi:hypothetical protein NQ317_013668 [Molorchus minor]|uniref:Uncharacterized protein n=1 Tax=Molorchus minor TaxID=1323400 RepID=A0ABQ9JBC2_9CUCU|nr:hypothetical protein NQ317_013668 [Molorchus minor]
MVRTTIQSEFPWKLQQVQDAANHLQQAIYHIDDVGKHYKFKYDIHSSHKKYCYKCYIIII